MKLLSDSDRATYGKVNTFAVPVLCTDPATDARTPSGENEQELRTGYN